jgi:alkylation response protein AidB-like acyl-CoA dehydrogenase
MTSLPVQATSDSELDTIFAPIFERIATGAVDREIDRRLPYAEIDWLRAANFGALRVPVEFGGYGATVRQLFRLLIDLAAAESNIPQALRVHFTFVEDRLLDGPGAKREHGCALWATVSWWVTRSPSPAWVRLTGTGPG